MAKSTQYRVIRPGGVVGFNGVVHAESPHTLADAFLRISCGVATGADDVFGIVAEDGIEHRIGPHIRRTNA